jgi:hypothetical protein
MRNEEVAVKLLLMLLLSCSFLAVGAVEGSYMKMAAPKIPFAPRNYVCYRAPHKIAVDGTLKDPAWALAPWTEDFVDIQGDLNSKPWFRTRAKMLWDDEYLYIGAELEEEHIWATLTKRDSVIFYDNDFEWFIDPDGDSHRYYELEINALGTVWDLFLSKPYRDDRQARPALTSWDIQGLKTAVHVNGTLNDPSDRDKSWTVEMAVPWEVLKECAPRKERPRPGDQWRVNFSRVEYRIDIKGGAYAKQKDPKTGRPLDEENWVWSPQGLINMHYPEMWGYVQFSAKTAGTGSEAFVVRDEERVKWALRRIYYAERMYRDEHGSFTEDLSSLGLTGLDLKGCLPPVVKVTPSLFEAVVQIKDGDSWHIQQDGLVWRGSEDKPDPAKPNAQDW